ncbi:hypothetical protein PINS_up002707 [Pythium insidiosum]|nr:hypothetical protein PINS_up002707 [Pythium insidiosum]
MAPTEDKYAVTEEKTTKKTKKKKKKAPTTATATKKKTTKKKQKEETHTTDSVATTATSLKSVAVKPSPLAASASSSSVVVPVDTQPGDGFAAGFYGLLLESKRVETLCRSLSLQPRHVARLRQLFDREDALQSRAITVDEFLSLIHEEKRALTTGIFAFVGLDAAPKRLSFDDFVLCVVTLASLSRRELLHYAFSLFDRDDSGILDARELHALCGDLRNRGFYFGKNVAVAQQKLTTRDQRGHAHAYGADGLVDLDDLVEGDAHFPAAFYPIVQMQRRVQQATLGEAFWAQVLHQRAAVETIVHYMRLHGGHLPPLSFREQLRAWGGALVSLATGGRLCGGAAYALRKLAINKFAEEERERRLAAVQEQQQREQQARTLLNETDGGEQAH